MHKYNDSLLVPTVAQIAQTLTYKRSKRFDKLNDLASVHSLLHDPEFQDIIIYPKEEKNFPLPSEKWCIAFGTDYLQERFIKYGPNIVGFDSCYKTNKYHNPL